MADPFDEMLGTGTYLKRDCLFVVFFFLQTLLSEKKQKDFSELRGPLIFKEGRRLQSSLLPQSFFRFPYSNLTFIVNQASLAKICVYERL